MADKMKIGKRIKEIREERGFTQEELGKQLGMNKSTIQRYETAKIENIKIPVIEKMAQILRVQPEWLSGISEDKYIFGSDEWNNNWDNEVNIFIQNMADNYNALDLALSKYFINTDEREKIINIILQLNHLNQNGINEIEKRIDELSRLEEYRQILEDE